MLIQPYISHPRGTIFYHLINFFFSKSCPIDLLRKLLKIIETMIFSLFFVLRKTWYFRQLWKIKKIWSLLSAFIWKCCFSCSVGHKPFWCSLTLLFSPNFMSPFFLSFSFFLFFCFMEPPKFFLVSYFYFCYPLINCWYFCFSCVPINFDWLANFWRWTTLIGLFEFGSFKSYYHVALINHNK